MQACDIQIEEIAPLYVGFKLYMFCDCSGNDCFVAFDSTGWEIKNKPSTEYLLRFLSLEKQTEI